MRLLRISLMALLLALIAGDSVPAQAQQQGETSGANALQTMRDSFVQTFNGHPLQVCQSEWESRNRVHGACRDLVTATTPDQALIAGLLVEFVFYDGTHYQRVNDADLDGIARRALRPRPDTRRRVLQGQLRCSAHANWPDQCRNHPTTQYQYWSLDKTFNEKVGGQAVYDLFLSAENRVISDVFSARGRIPGLGCTLAQTWVYSGLRCRSSSRRQRSSRCSSRTWACTALPWPTRNERCIVKRTAWLRMRLRR